jgi:hypothetical protein
MRAWRDRHRDCFELRVWPRRRPRIEDIRENVERMRQAWATESEARLIVQHFNAKLSTKASAGFWPTIAKAITAKHPWLVIVCDSCGTVVDLDLRVKPRDPEASVRVALKDVRCPRCNGHGRPRIIALAVHPSI